MRVDESKIKRPPSTAELLPETIELLRDLSLLDSDVTFCDKLRTASDEWKYGKTDLSHWVAVLNRCDRMLADCVSEVEDKWHLAVDVSQSQRINIIQVLEFTAKLYENSYSHHLYSSTENLVRLLDSEHMDVVLSVLRVLYVFSRRSAILCKVSKPLLTTLTHTLTCLAESWGGKFSGHSLAQCCSSDAPGLLPLSVSVVDTDNQHVDTGTATNGTHPKPRTRTERITNIDPGKSAVDVLCTFSARHELSEESAAQMYVRVRLAYAFADTHTRYKCLLARLLSISVLVYMRALQSAEVQQNVLYSGLVEEMVELLKLPDTNDERAESLSMVKLETVRALTAIIYVDKENGSYAECVSVAAEAKQFHGLLAKQLRVCVGVLLKPDTAQAPSPSAEFCTAVLSFAYHLAGRSPTIAEQLIESGVTDTLLGVVGDCEMPDAQLGFVTRCVRILDALTSADAAAARDAPILTALVQRLDHEVSVCRVAQPYEIAVEEPAGGSGTQELQSPPNTPGPATTPGPMDTVSDATQADADGSALHSANTQRSDDTTINQTESQSVVPGLALVQPEAPSPTLKCAHIRSALLKSLMNFLKRYVHQESNEDRVAALLAGPLCSCLKHIVSNVHYYDHMLFQNALQIVTDLIVNFPSQLRHLQRKGVTTIIMQALLGNTMPASRDVLSCVHNMFTALCMNTAGVSAFVKYQPFDKLVAVFLSPRYLAALKRKRGGGHDVNGGSEDTASSLGSATEVLLQGQPALVQPAVDALITLLNELTALGTNAQCLAVDKYASDLVPLDPALYVSSESSMYPSAGVLSEHAMNADGRVLVPLADYLHNVLRYVEAFATSNHPDHVRVFIASGGVQRLLALLNMPHLNASSLLTNDCTPSSSVVTVLAICRFLMALQSEGEVARPIFEQLFTLMQQSMADCELLNEMAHNDTDTTKASSLLTRLMSDEWISLEQAQTQLTACCARVMLNMHLFKQVACIERDSPSTGTARATLHSVCLQECSLALLQRTQSMVTQLAHESHVISRLCVAACDIDTHDTHLAACDQWTEPQLKQIAFLAKLRVVPVHDVTETQSSTTATAADSGTPATVCASSLSGTAQTDNSEQMDTSTQSCNGLGKDGALHTIIKQLDPSVKLVARLLESLEAVHQTVVRSLYAVTTAAQRRNQRPAQVIVAKCTDNEQALSAQLLTAQREQMITARDGHPAHIETALYNRALRCSVLATVLARLECILFDKGQVCRSVALHEHFYRLCHRTVFNLIHDWLGVTDYEHEVELSHVQIACLQQDGFSDMLCDWLCLVRKLVNPASLTENVQRPGGTVANDRFWQRGYLMLCLEQARARLPLILQIVPQMKKSAVTSLCVNVLQQVIKGSIEIADMVAKENLKETPEQKAKKNAALEEYIDQRQVNQLMAMGFDRAACVQALIRFGNNFDEATDGLLRESAAAQRQNMRGPSRGRGRGAVQGRASPPVSAAVAGNPVPSQQARADTDNLVRDALEGLFDNPPARRTGPATAAAAAAAAVPAEESESDALRRAIELSLQSVSATDSSTQVSVSAMDTATADDDQSRMSAGADTDNTTTAALVTTEHQLPPPPLPSSPGTLDSLAEFIESSAVNFCMSALDWSHDTNNNTNTNSTTSTSNNSTTSHSAVLFDVAELLSMVTKDMHSRNRDTTKAISNLLGNVVSRCEQVISLVSEKTPDPKELGAAVHSAQTRLHVFCVLFDRLGTLMVPALIGSDLVTWLLQLLLAITSMVHGKYMHNAQVLSLLDPCILLLDLYEKHALIDQRRIELYRTCGDKFQWRWWDGRTWRLYGPAITHQLNDAFMGGLQTVTIANQGSPLTVDLHAMTTQTSRLHHSARPVDMQPIPSNAPHVAKMQGKQAPDQYKRNAVPQLSEAECSQLIEQCVELFSCVVFNASTANSLLRLCVRVTRAHASAASEFVQLSGIERVLGCTFTEPLNHTDTHTLHTMTACLIRNVCEDSDTLEMAMEKVIRAVSAGSTSRQGESRLRVWQNQTRGAHTNVDMLLRTLAPVAARQPDLFLTLCKRILRLPATAATGAAGARDDSSEITVVPPQPHSAGSKPGSTALAHVTGLLLPRCLPPDVLPNEKHNGLPRSTVLCLLCECVRSYSHVATAIVDYTHEGKPLLSLLLKEYLHKEVYNTTCALELKKLDQELVLWSNAVRQLLITMACCNQCPRAQDAVLGHMKTMMQGAVLQPSDTPAKYNHIQELASLLFSMRQECAVVIHNTGNTSEQASAAGRTPSLTNHAIVRISHRRHIFLDLARCIMYLDLSHANAVACINQVLKTLEDLAKWINQSLPVSTSASSGSSQTPAEGFESTDQTLTDTETSAAQPQLATRSHRLESALAEQAISQSSAGDDDATQTVPAGEVDPFAGQMLPPPPPMQESLSDFANAEESAEAALNAHDVTANDRRSSSSESDNDQDDNDEDEDDEDQDGGMHEDDEEDEDDALNYEDEDDDEDEDEDEDVHVEQMQVRVEHVHPHEHVVQLMDNVMNDLDSNDGDVQSDGEVGDGQEEEDEDTEGNDWANEDSDAEQATQHAPAGRRDILFLQARMLMNDDEGGLDGQEAMLMRLLADMGHENMDGLLQLGGMQYLLGARHMQQTQQAPAAAAPARPHALLTRVANTTNNQPTNRLLHNELSAMMQRAREESSATTPSTTTSNATQHTQQEHSHEHRHALVRQNAIRDRFGHRMRRVAGEIGIVRDGLDELHMMMARGHGGGRQHRQQYGRTAGLSVDGRGSNQRASVPSTLSRWTEQSTELDGYSVHLLLCVLRQQLITHLQTVQAEARAKQEEQRKRLEAERKKEAEEKAAEIKAAKEKEEAKMDTTEQSSATDSVAGAQSTAANAISNGLEPEGDSSVELLNSANVSSDLVLDTSADSGPLAVSGESTRHTGTRTDGAAPALQDTAPVAQAPVSDGSASSAPTADPVSADAVQSADSGSAPQTQDREAIVVDDPTSTSATTVDTDNDEPYIIADRPEDTDAAVASAESVPVVAVGDTEPEPEPMDTNQTAAVSATNSDRAESAERLAHAAAVERMRAVLGDTQVPFGLDPEFIAALPEDMRREVIEQHMRVQRLNEMRATQATAATATATNSTQNNESGAASASAATGAASSATQATANETPEISQEFLDALPPEIQEEVLAQQRLERERAQRAATGAATSAAGAQAQDFDPASFFASLAPSLRQQVLADADDTVIQALPRELAAEAQTIRAQLGVRAQMREEMIGHHDLLQHIIGIDGNAGVRLRFTADARRLGAAAGAMRGTANRVGQMAGQAAVPHHMSAHQLLDKESLSVLLVLFFMESKDTIQSQSGRLAHNRLLKILKSLAAHAPTCHYLINALLAILVKLKNVDAASKDELQRQLPVSAKQGTVTRGWLDNLQLHMGLGNQCNVVTIRAQATGDDAVTVHPLVSARSAAWLLDTLISVGKSYPGLFLPASLRQAPPKAATSSSPTTHTVDAPEPNEFWRVIMRVNSDAADPASLALQHNQKMGKMSKGQQLARSFEMNDDVTYSAGQEMAPFIRLMHMVHEHSVLLNQALLDRLLKLLCSVAQTLPDHKDTVLQSALPLDSALKALVHLIVTADYSTEANHDARLLLMELARAVPPSYRKVLYDLLLDGLLQLGQSLNQDMDLFYEQVSALQVDQPATTNSASGSSADLGTLADRFDAQRHVVITAPVKTAHVTAAAPELQVPAVTALTGTRSHQSQFLRTLHTLVAVRDQMNKRAQLADTQSVLVDVTSTAGFTMPGSTPVTTAVSAEQAAAGASTAGGTEGAAVTATPAVNGTVQAQSSAAVETDSQNTEQTQAQQSTATDLTQTSMSQDKEVDEMPLVQVRPVSSFLGQLSGLWQSLSKALTRLGNSTDPHSVMILKPASEAFFLVHADTLGAKASKERSATDSQNSGPVPVSVNSALTSGSALDHTSKDIPHDLRVLLKFAHEHRRILNQVLRQMKDPLSDGPFTILLEYPRLLDFDVKRTYFERQLKLLIDRHEREDAHIRVRRSQIFHDSFRELFRLNAQQWKSRFYIVFQGEEGQDAGGLLREWYQVVTREIFNANYALFTTAPGDKVTYMINRTSYVNPEHLQYFKFVGRLIAKAVYDSKLLECFFTRAFYKHILNKKISYRDIEAEDPALFKSLEFTLTTPLEDLGLDLTFTYEADDFGKRETRPLKEGGSSIKVTDENKLEYVQLLCHMRMTESIRQQLDAFLEGFYEVIPKQLISMFDEQELELLISGLPSVDIEDLRKTTEYRNYTKDSPQIKWLWRALRSFTQEDRAKFLQFVTGTSKVPLQGFAHLEGMNGPQRFSVHLDGRSTDRLPQAHTCFNQLDLPAYETYDKLHQQLLTCVHECSEGFGFA